MSIAKTTNYGHFERDVDISTPLPGETIRRIAAKGKQ